MSQNTGIEWTDATWNPVRGCSRVSEGCRNCYAETVAARFSDVGSPYHGFAERGRPGSKWTGKVAVVPNKLDEPMRWRKPRRIFVNSMSDLFHEDLPDDDIDQVFAVMALAPHHTFQILTKRAARMHAYMTERWQPAPAQRLVFGNGDALDVPAERRGETRRTQVELACEPFLERFNLADPNRDELWTADGDCKAMQWEWPLPNVWLGVSVENQAAANERIPHLLRTPAAKRFLSCEPLLGRVDLNAIALPGGHASSLDGWEEHGGAGQCIAWMPPLDQVIAGGESGPNARPMAPIWVCDLRDDCSRAGVPFFFKQWGEWGPARCRPSGTPGRYAIAPREFSGMPFETDSYPRMADLLGSDLLERIGKRAAGASLGGRQHHEFPA